MSAAVLDRARLLQRIDALAAIGADPEGGVSRLAYSAADGQACRLAGEWMAAAGMAVSIDAAGNLIGRVEGAGDDGRALVLGSHLDTVVAGGRLDGAYGVLAAIECVAAISASGQRPRHRLVVVAFANEEGARGSVGFDGSRAVVGRPNALDRPDREGVTYAERLAAAGGRPDALPTAAWAAGSVACYLELHIEQGPVLDHRNIPIGIVTGITGRRNVDVIIEGSANHAGTTPMGLRRDALVAAARVMLEVEALPSQDVVRVATTGSIEARPNVRNVVAGWARLGVDLRDLDERRLDAAVAELTRRCARIAAETGTALRCLPAGEEVAAPTDERIMAAFEAAAAARQLVSTRLVSGAGHDAQVLALLGPIGMLFVPSRAGISHSPLEHTEPAQLVAGAEVLLDAVQALDRTLQAP